MNISSAAEHQAIHPPTSSGLTAPTRERTSCARRLTDGASPMYRSKSDACPWDWSHDPPSGLAPPRHNSSMMASRLLARATNSGQRACSRAAAHGSRDCRTPGSADSRTASFAVVTARVAPEEAHGLDNPVEDRGGVPVVVCKAPMPAHLHAKLLRLRMNPLWSPSAGTQTPGPPKRSPAISRWSPAS